MAKAFNLIVSLPNEDPVQYVLNANRVGVGRSPDNQIQILVREVSTAHSELKKTDEGYEIVDLNSSNGTKVNGKALEPNASHKLVDGDRILFGDTVPSEFLESDGTALKPSAMKLTPPKSESPAEESAPAKESAAPAAPATKRPALKKPVIGKKLAPPSKAPISPGASTVVLKKTPSTPNEDTESPKQPSLTPTPTKKLVKPLAKKAALKPPPQKKAALSPAPLKPTPLKPPPSKSAAKSEPVEEVETPAVEAEAPAPPAKPALKKPALKLARKFPAKKAAAKPEAKEPETEAKDTPADPTPAAAEPVELNTDGSVQLKKPNADGDATPVLKKPTAAPSDAAPVLKKSDDVTTDETPSLKVSKGGSDAPPKLIVPKK